MGEGVNSVHDDDAYDRSVLIAFSREQCPYIEGVGYADVPAAKKGIIGLAGEVLAEIQRGCGSIESYQLVPGTS